MDNRKNQWITKKITVWGIVQGVGFRPLVYRLAQKHSVKGTVRNLGGLVEIIAQTNNAESFLEDLKTAKISGEIINIEIEDIIDRQYKDFRIIESGIKEDLSIIPPDLPFCPHCRKELFENKNRRYKNPFISCMSCGPRYTIIEQLPYDRHTTSMRDFDMCAKCCSEYTSPEDRRFHAQTISCNDCGPYLIFDDFTDEKALNKAVEILNSGGIIAVKGIGGYHFACSPFIEDTVNRLRSLKGREQKPFAVMFESLDSIKEYCQVSDEETKLLQSNPRPIVLLYSKGKNMAQSTGRGSIYCGGFLPYTPLQALLLKMCGPLIMTSANIADKPIIKDDSEMLSLKSTFLDGVLYNKRRIVRSVDDSVAKIIDGKPQLIRRSRGYVPYPVFLPKDNNNMQIFAAGGDLKAAFCLYKGGNAVVSQYFGDLQEKSVFEQYKASHIDLSHLLKIKPHIAVCDMHPDYFSSKYAQTLGIPVIYTQHHHAHIASVMAEHHMKEKVIGIAFDGTGYGTDGNIWGGEFLVCEGADFKRAAHLAYTPILGGDSSMKDAKKTAACYLLNCGLDEFIDDDRLEIIKSAVYSRINTVLTSSMGRLFDAVSAILNIQNENRYEGECGAKLEKEAVLALREKTNPAKLSFAIYRKNGIIEIDSKPVLSEICKLKDKASARSIALGFHFSVAELIAEVCEIIGKEHKTNTVAISGGVFQNTVLTERTLKLLRSNGFKVYYNIAVPPNDGCISLGQAYIGLLKGDV